MTTLRKSISLNSNLGSCPVRTTTQFRFTVSYPVGKIMVLRLFFFLFWVLNGGWKYVKNVRECRMRKNGTSCGHRITSTPTVNAPTDWRGLDIGKSRGKNESSETGESTGWSGKRGLWFSTKDVALMPSPLDGSWLNTVPVTPIVIRYLHMYVCMSLFLAWSKFFLFLFDV